MTQFQFEVWAIGRQDERVGKITLNGVSGTLYSTTAYIYVPFDQLQDYCIGDKFVLQAVSLADQRKSLSDLRRCPNCKSADISFMWSPDGKWLCHQCATQFPNPLTAEDVVT